MAQKMPTRGSATSPRIDAASGPEMVDIARRSSTAARVLRPASLLALVALVLEEEEEEEEAKCTRREESCRTRSGGGTAPYASSAALMLFLALLQVAVSCC